MGVKAHLEQLRKEPGVQRVRSTSSSLEEFYNEWGQSKGAVT